MMSDNNNQTTKSREYDPIGDPESISVIDIEEIADWFRKRATELLGRLVEWVDPE